MDYNIRIAGIVEESIVDGPGIRYVVFAQGCRHKCPGCHNEHTHSFTDGTIINIDTVIDGIKKNPLLDGITISGGEPFEQGEAFGELAKRVSLMGYNVYTYSGYTYKEIIAGLDKNTGWEALLKNTDVLIDGRFEVDKKNLLLKFRGSENQRVIDVKQSLNKSKVMEKIL